MSETSILGEHWFRDDVRRCPEYRPSPLVGGMAVFTMDGGKTWYTENGLQPTCDVCACYHDTPRSKRLRHVIVVDPNPQENVLAVAHGLTDQQLADLQEWCDRTHCDPADIADDLTEHADTLEPGDHKLSLGQWIEAFRHLASDRDNDPPIC
jgi:hypothetical protein